MSLAEISKPGIRNIHNVRVRSIEKVSAPETLAREIPLTEKCLATVTEGRETIARIMHKEAPRLLVIIGPCSIHDVKSALEYAGHLSKLRNQVALKAEIVMRVYFEKPRTTTGWKGLINDPDLDDSCNIEKGLRTARKLLKDITEMGLPVATEFLDSISPQYLGDFVSWAAIGARTTESQSHREMASGLSMPVGYKNSTDGSLQVALDAMKASLQPHSFLGVNDQGLISLIRTKGNELTHPILRGGSRGENYAPEHVQETKAKLKKLGLPEAIMIDCSHGNSNKLPERQELVWKSILDQRAAGESSIIGAMLESNLHHGNQSIPKNLNDLQYGVSITDACISWEKTEELFSSM